jgi:hypothetical protein
MPEPISFVRKITIRSDTRAMITNKTSIIKLRKYLRPEDAGDLIEDFILSLHIRSDMAEFVFYFQKVLYSLCINSIGARYLLLLEKAADLPNAINSTRARLWK